MELRQLEYLVAVAEEANFTRAAERVHISQSGVSAQVRQLEKDLGATLIDRSGRSATLTGAGEAAVVHARAVLSSTEALRRAVDDVTGVVRGKLTIGMLTGSQIEPLFDALAAFHTEHPGVEITLFEDDSLRLVELVREGDADVALVSTAGDPPEGLTTLPIARDRLVLATRPDHPLSGRKRVRLADVCAHPIVCLPAGTGIRTAFEQACAARGLTPQIAFEASAPDAAAGLASRGLGAAVLSATPAADHEDRLHVIPIRDADVPAVLSLVWSKAGGPALTELVDRFCVEIGRPGSRFLRRNGG